MTRPTTPTHTLAHSGPAHGRTLTPAQIDRAHGALIGSAVADAAGAPFEFGPAGQWSARFPAPVVGGTGELVGGGSFGWAPGEFTDDTQMALALAEALVAVGGYDPAVVWEHFRAWSMTARDMGFTTSAALAHEEHLGAAEAAHVATGGRSGSNGSVMRIAPVGVFGVGLGRDAAWDLAVAQSSLTHHDEIASAAAALVAETIRATILHGDFEVALAGAVAHLLTTPLREVWERELAEVCSLGWDPHTDDGPSNGSARTALAQAIWAVRTGASFHDVVVVAVDLGGDTDTVAAIAGAMAGAKFGFQAIPVRWSTYVHGTVDLPSGERRYDGLSLVDLGRQLLGLQPADPNEPLPFDRVGLVAERLWAANLGGASTVPTDRAVVSMCHTLGLFDGHPLRRQVFLRDETGDKNPRLHDVVLEVVDAIDAFLAEGHDVVVHCHAGASRTTLALRAWYMRTHGVGHDEAWEWIESVWGEQFDPWNRTFNHFLDHEWTATTWQSRSGVTPAFGSTISTDTAISTDTTTDTQGDT